MHLRAAVFVFTSLFLTAFAIDDYQLGPLSMEKPVVPKGTVTQMPQWKSKIFAGTTRDWWIYVPAQYKAGQPAT
jgi:enterochelin esterase family protein